MDFRQIEKDLQIEFATNRINAERVAALNLTRVNSVPAYKKFDDLERKIVFEISKCKTKDEKYNELKDNLETVRNEKKKILSKLNFTEKDLKPKYKCNICKDSGYVGGKQCECFKRRKNKELIKAFGISVDKDCSFKTFDTKICKSAKHAEILKKLAEIMQKWAEKYPNNQKNNIIISGKTGVGKTYLSACLANEFMQKNASVCFVSAFDLNQAFLKFHTAFDSSKSSWLEPFIEADLLVIDDLGTEPLFKNVTKNYLYLVLSERERFNRPVVITTNLLPADINNRYDERIYSRLSNKRYSILCLVEGDDLRITK